MILKVQIEQEILDFEGLQVAKVIARSPLSNRTIPLGIVWGPGLTALSYYKSREVYLIIIENGFAYLLMLTV